MTQVAQVPDDGEAIELDSFANEKFPPHVWYGVSEGEKSVVIEVEDPHYSIHMKSREAVAEVIRALEKAADRVFGAKP